MTTPNDTLDIHRTPKEDTLDVGGWKRCQEEDEIFPRYGSARLDNDVITVKWGVLRRRLEKAYRLGRKAGREEQMRTHMKSIVAQREKRGE